VLEALFILPFQKKSKILKKMKKINCILLIDDNVADNVYHKIIIEEANICNHIILTTNGKEALDYIIKASETGNSESFPKPDIIYLDINMPVMNGFEFLEEYKNLNEKLKSKVLIIMLTASLNADDKIKAMSYKEVSEFQNKSLTVEVIKETVAKYFKYNTPDFKK
jgi:CheY-like chemotaxis protein